MNVVIYTDASYNEKRKISACGYFILVNDKPWKHEVLLLGGVINNTQAEVYSIVFALKWVKKNVFHIKNIGIYTDHLSFGDQ